MPNKEYHPFSTLASACLVSTLAFFSPIHGKPVEKNSLAYIDVVSLQIDRRESWYLGNLGFNLSRYIGILALENHSLYPGLGIRGKIGENPKVELFPKMTFAGILGGSMGVVYGEEGTGFGTSLWAGPGLFGAEYSFYSDKGGVDHEISLYLAYQFGYGGAGSYDFKNFIFHSASEFK